LPCTEELYARQQFAKRNYRERTTPFWMIYETVVSLLMIGAVAALYVYVFIQSPDAPVKVRGWGCRCMAAT
jgi:hypothetical protein